jgi:hypothetical protein
MSRRRFGGEPVVRGSFKAPSKLLSDLVVFCADFVLAVEPLEPVDRKMTTGHLLEVLDKRIVHRCVYRKLKLGRSGGEVRPGWRVN